MLYCTSNHIRNRISDIGADLRIDDNPGSLTSVIEEASIEVNGYCQLIYDQNDLASSAWIRLKTTDIAVFFLCMRRLNTAPKSAQMRYEKAIEDLEKVRTGQITIPDAAMTRGAAPVLSNQRLRLRPFPRVATEPGRSTGSQGDYVPHNDPTDYRFYDI